MQALSSSTGVAQDSLVMGILDILLSTQFEIDTFQCPVNGICDCKKISKPCMGRVIMENCFEK